MTDQPAKEKLLTYFANRLNAGLPLTLKEWEKLSEVNREIWEEAYTQYKVKDLAITAHFIADSIKGGTLAIEAVWDILPEDVQDAYVKKWGELNAERSE